MPDLTPMTRQEKFLNGDTDLEPITRREHFYAGREGELPEGSQDPQTREEWFIKKYREAGDVTVESLSVTSNGTYTAPSGKAYSPVHVNVPLPASAYLKKSAESYPITPSQLPLPKAEVAFSGDKAELYVGSEPIVVTEDNAPYLYRQSPSGKSYVDLSVVGGTVAWNQLVNKSVLRESGTVGDITLTNNNDGYLYISGSISNSYIELSGNLTLNFIKGHKYLFNIPTAPSGVNRLFTLYGTAFGNYTFTSPTVKECENTVTERVYPRFGSNKTVSVNNFKYYVGIIDLTQMLGSTIADYVYTLEQSTAGSGIAWLKSYGYLTKDYYAYSSGKLESVNVASRKVYDSNNTLLATYPFDSSKILRGIPKLSNGQMYYDGDVYNSDGTITRNYEERAYQSGDESLANAITDGTTTVVKLQTPTTESATPYTNPQIVGSTEEFIDAGTSASTPTRDVAIPVGQDSKYHTDLKAKLEELAKIPDVPSTNGTYTLKATRSASGVEYNWVSG